MAFSVLQSTSSGFATACRYPAIASSSRVRFVRAVPAGVEDKAQGADWESTVSKRLRDLSESLILPPGFLKRLPKDLQTDVRDAAFALSKGPVYQECGDQAGKVIEGLSTAWENLDTDSVTQIARTLTTLQGVISKSSNGPAIGKRLITAGKIMKRTGQYGKGEFQKLANALMALGEAIGGFEEQPVDVAALPRVLKWGDLEVEVTTTRAFFGAVVASVLGILSWQLNRGIQDVPDTPFDLSNENASMFANTLKSTLLLASYSGVGLSAAIAVALTILGIQLLVDGKK